ncbi:MAG TPA: glucose 1-dehydrogenase [Candidatus Binatia bacterium]|jgi:threonine dehydrogenase-like Zn-dependent dehydrogenase
MKAITVSPTSRTISLQDIAEPASRLGPGQVRVRILDVGICGTDREICCFDYGQPPEGCEHLVIGHESLGEVVETAPDVTTVDAGDLVVPTVRRPCHHEECAACTSSRQDFCYTGDFVERGIKQAHGYMTELVVDHERYMNVLPKSLRDVGVLVEPLTIAEKALEQIWQVQQRLPWACPVVPGTKGGNCHRAVVLGAGPVGLLGAMALAANDFDTFVYSREPHGSAKSRLVESFGAHYISAADTPVKDLGKQVGNIDVIYEAAGASSVAFDAMGSLGTNGIFVFTGVPGRKGPIPVDTDVLMRSLVLKNQVVFGTVNAGKTSFEHAVSDLARFCELWPGAVHSLISSRRRVDDYREPLLGKPDGIKNVLTFG